ncbi:hypothetical protein K470DRAFT_214044 [Piedraia hortae CBS 480.64]|uniref:Autophagy-related protein 101 n=1 Tax=Piedraia hortae CBS 480.64 TaxID=1314780 RepID=A0A6A7C407_9PEZI|nr:hypothetical protein K470DRAFT_214044 [Piedraia hortae CBS 480.64]
MSPAQTCSLALHSDRSSLQATLSALLHVIFFHRVMAPLRPVHHHVLDLITLPRVPDEAIERTISGKSAELFGHLAGNSMSAKTTVILQFLDDSRASSAAPLQKRSRGGWFSSPQQDTHPTAEIEPEVWESWAIDISLLPAARDEGDKHRVRKAMEDSLINAALQVGEFAGTARPPPGHSAEGMRGYRILVYPRVI